MDYYSCINRTYKEADDSTEAIRIQIGKCDVAEGDCEQKCKQSFEQKDVLEDCQQKCLQKYFSCGDEEIFSFYSNFLKKENEWNVIKKLVK